MLPSMRLLCHRTSTPFCKRKGNDLIITVNKNDSVSYQISKINYVTASKRWLYLYYPYRFTINYQMPWTEWTIIPMLPYPYPMNIIEVPIYHPNTDFHYKLLELKDLKDTLQICKESGITVYDKPLNKIQ
jgi:hypothetical protein